MTMPGSQDNAPPTGLPQTSGRGLPPPGGRSAANRFAGEPVKWFLLGLFSFFAAVVPLPGSADDICEPAPPLSALCFGELETDFGMVGTLPSFEVSDGDRSYAVSIEISDQLQPGSPARVVHDLAATVLKKKTGEVYDFDAVAFVKANMHKYPKQFAASLIRDGRTLSLKARKVGGIEAITATQEKRVWTDKHSGIRTAFAIDTTMIEISTLREGFDPDARDEAVHEAVLRAIKVNE